MHLSEPSSATVISRLRDRQEAQLAADTAAAKHKLPPFWSNPSDSISHSTHNAAAGGLSHNSEKVDQLLAKLEEVQPAAPPSRALVSTLKGCFLFTSKSFLLNTTSLTHSYLGKYYELVSACSELDTQALGALSRANFERALSSPTLRLQPHEVFS